MSPKLTHHEINNCRDAVLFQVEHRKTQLEALRVENTEVLSKLTFTDQEMEQIRRYGAALIQGPTDFDEEVEKRLAALYPKEFSDSPD